MLATASAPGKVLIIGGYLVVEAPNVGISIGVDARFHTDIISSPECCCCCYSSGADKTKQQQEQQPQPTTTAKSSYTVRVDSPQFGKKFTFSISLQRRQDKDSSSSVDDEVMTIDQVDDGAPKNIFLAHAVLFSLATAVATSSGGGNNNNKASSSLGAIFSKSSSMSDDKTKKKQPCCNSCLILVLRASNDFYSQQQYLTEHKMPVCVASLRKVPPFSPLLGAVSKTGLGSSAALTSSVVAVLMRYAQTRLAAVGAVSEKNSDNNQQQTSSSSPSSTTPTKSEEDRLLRELVHRVAQSAHCVAQGKVGSGFDVYTAVYGTCAYTRFDAKRIEPLMAMRSVNNNQDTTAAGNALSASFNHVSVSLNDLVGVVLGGNHQNNSASSSSSSSSMLSAVDRDEWVPRTAVLPNSNRSGGGSFISLPKNFKLLLADIHAGGSETPGMVQKVFAWKKTLDPNDSNNLWNTVARSNIECIRALVNLMECSKKFPTEYAQASLEVSKMTSREDICFEGIGEEDRARRRENQLVFTSGEVDMVQEILAAFGAVRNAFNNCRRFLRDVGRNAGVEIEPTKLTPLLDSMMNDCRGIIAAGCPGAGGYDAVFALAVEVDDNNNNNNNTNEQQGEEKQQNDKHDNSSVCSEIEKFWEGYTRDGLHVCPLLVREAGGGLEF